MPYAIILYVIIDKGKEYSQYSTTYAIELRAFKNEHRNF